MLLVNAFNKSDYQHPAALVKLLQSERIMAAERAWPSGSRGFLSVACQDAWTRDNVQPFRKEHPARVALRLPAPQEIYIERRRMMDRSIFVMDSRVVKNMARGFVPGRDQTSSRQEIEVGYSRRTFFYTRRGEFWDGLKDRSGDDQHLELATAAAWSPHKRNVAHGRSRPMLTVGRTASVQRRHEQCMDRRCWRMVAYPDITPVLGNFRVAGNTFVFA